MGMAALESTSVQAVLETPSELDAPDAEEGAVSPLSVEDSRYMHMYMYLSSKHLSLVIGPS